MRKRYERYDLAEFARLYYEEELSSDMCAARMNVDPWNLRNAVKEHGLVLRTHSEAQILAYSKCRKVTPIPESPIDWDVFRHHYYNLNETYVEIAPLFGISPTTLQARAIERGYLSRRAVRRPKKIIIK